jgi:hypothetical protein
MFLPNTNSDNSTYLCILKRKRKRMRRRKRRCLRKREVVNVKN